MVAVQWKWRHFQTLFLIAKMASMLASLSWLYPPSGGLVHDSIKVKMSQFLTGRISHALGDTLVARERRKNRALPAAPSQVCSIFFTETDRSRSISTRPYFLSVVCPLVGTCLSLPPLSNCWLKSRICLILRTANIPPYTIVVSILHTTQSEPT